MFSPEMEMLEPPLCPNVLLQHRQLQISRPLRAFSRIYLNVADRLLNAGKLQYYSVCAVVDMVVIMLSLYR